MKRLYRPNAFASVAELACAIRHQDRPVVLVEGTRDLPEADRRRVVALGQMLALDLPRAIFRTGNATGSDTAFAEGVAAVDANRLQYVLPHAGMGRQRRRAESLAVALDAVPPAAEQVLANATASASPRSQRLVELYVREKGGSAPAAKGAYLMRDTLKVLGCAELHLAPATVGIFYVNEADPMAGGTGHTLRVCIEHGVPVVPQKIWRNWLTSSPADSPPPGCSHL